MKKLYFVLLTLFFPIIANAFVGNVKIDGIWYNIVSKVKSAEVIFPEDSQRYSGEINIPETVEYEGVICEVTSIGKNAFNLCEQLTSITIPKTINTIKGYAFYGCTNLQKVNIESLSSWCNISFEAISVVQDYKGFANPLYYAHHLFFNGEEVKNLIIPNDVTSISEYCFVGGSSIESVSIHPNIKTINRSAFDFCNGLNAVHISDLSSWCKMTIMSNPLSYAHHLFLNGEEIIDLIIPSDISTIRDGIFSGGSNFSTITIPQTITEIGAYAFSGCSKIRELEIPNGVSSIGYSAFRECQSICSLSIPNSVNSIDSYAFAYCTGMSYASISNSIKTINEATFRNCSSLSTIIIPDQVTKIDRNAFDGCAKLTEVYLGNGVLELGYKAFGSCTEITDVFCYADKIPYNNGAFSDSYAEYATLHVKDKLLNSYQNNWKEFGAYQRLPEVVYKIDGELYATDYVIIGTEINPIKDPEKEGYSFTGWSDIPELMPKTDVEVNGSFIINSYMLIYKVDNDVYKSEEIKFGEFIIPEEEPIKEGHSFSGWSEIPETMPAHDLIINGSFIVNKYKVTYIIDGEVLKTDYVEYGATIVPPTVEDKEGYTFTGWTDVPETMPAHDITIYGSFTSGIEEIKISDMAGVKIYTIDGKRIGKIQRGINIIREVGGKVRKVRIK